MAELNTHLMRVWKPRRLKEEWRQYGNLRSRRWTGLDVVGRNLDTMPRKGVDMPSQMSSERNLVVVHFKDDKLRKGYTHDFTPGKETFHLTSEEEDDKGTIYEIRTEELKAVFFVKTLEGNRDYVEKKRFDEVDASRLRGLKIKVEFLDGEIIRGVSLGYSKGRKGFFVVPVDPDENNERIYVVADSVRDVKLGSAAER